MATKKPTLREAAVQVSSKYSDIFTDNAQLPLLFEADFMLLVQTFVMEGSFDGFEKMKERRFRDVLGRQYIKKFDAIAKEDGSPTILELAKAYAATTDPQTVTEQSMADLNRFKPTAEQMEESIKTAWSKLIGDFSG